MCPYSGYQLTTRELAGRRWLASCPGPATPGAHNAAIRNSRDPPIGLPLSVRLPRLLSAGTLDVTDVMSGGRGPITSCLDAQLPP